MPKAGHPLACGRIEGTYYYQSHVTSCVYREEVRIQVGAWLEFVIHIVMEGGP